MKQKILSTSEMFSTENFIATLGKAFWLIILIVNAFVLSNILQKTPYQDIKNIFLILLISYSILGIMKDFIPTYIPKSNLISPILPVGFFRKTIISLTDEFFSFFYLSFFIFLGIYIISFKLYGSFYLLFIAILNIFFVKYFLKNFLESGFKDWFVIFSLLSATIVGCVLYFNHQKSEYIIIWLNLYLSACYCVSLKFEKKIDYQSHTPFINLYSWNIILNNSSSRITILMYIILKIAFCCFILYTPNKLKEMAFTLTIFSLIISPVMLFTYLFNNLFGFLREYWISIFLINGRKTKLIVFYLKLLLPFLIFDFLLFYIEYLTNKLPQYFTPSIYLVQSITLLLIGVLGTFIKPMRVNNKTLLTSYSTNLIVNLIMGVVIYLGVLLYLIHYEICYFPILIALNLLIWIKFKTLIKNYQYKFFYINFK